MADIPTASVEEARRQYPQFVWAFDHPDVGPLLKQSVQENWPPGRLTGRIMETGWWKGTLPSLREFQAKQVQDPAWVDQQLRQKLPQLWDQWLSLGLPPPSEQLISDFARQAISLAWSEGQITDAMMAHAKYNSGQPRPVGTLGSTMTDLKARARAYYLPLDDETAFNFARSVAAGERRAEDYDVMFQEQAKGRFPSLTKYIESGIKPADFFRPYQTTVADLLEVSPDAVDFMSDPKFSSIIDKVDDKTGERRPMTLNETQVHVRGLDEWKTTRQGQAAAATAADGILKMFGKVAS
jgi:hypothetical protein